jgi:hypothetical protein
MDESKPLPVFVPPLAMMLARAELSKNAPLTQAEAEKVRDASICIMMPPAEAAAMTEKRGYVDVNPDNCFPDWHRLRTQMTGKGFLPRLVLCVPGDDAFRSRAEAIVQKEQIEHEFRPHDPRLLQAFSAASMAWPSLERTDLDRIAAHTTVLYVVSPNFTAGEAGKVGRQFLALGRHLLEAGGIAIKCESSGIAHSHRRWISHQERADRPNGLWAGLFSALVCYPIGDDREMYTCGLHLLGIADLVIDGEAIQRIARPGQAAAATAARLFETFALYLLGECPVGGFASGHTFSADATSPRLRVTWEPCQAYEEDDLFFNPFGRWRFRAP